MDGTAPHNSGRCRDKSRSDSNTQTSMDLRYLIQTNTRYEADIDKVKPD